MAVVLTVVVLVVGLARAAVNPSTDITSNQCWLSYLKNVINYSSAYLLSTYISKITIQQKTKLCHILFVFKAEMISFFGYSRAAEQSVSTKMF